MDEEGSASDTGNVREEAGVVTTRADRVRAINLKFLRWLRVFAPFAFLLLLDPFGCAKQARVYSQQQVMRIVSPLRGYPGGDKLGQQKVLVVLIDQKSLEGISTKPQGERVTWPIPRTQQIDFILKPIFQTHPRAVFVDYTFNADSLPDDVPAACVSADGKACPAMPWSSPVGSAFAPANGPGKPGVRPASLGCGQHASPERGLRRK